MKLINVDAYSKKICTYNETGCGSCAVQTACPFDEPTIDAEPVKHGKWMEIIETNELGEPYQSGVYCSECGHIDCYESNYCPDCGARMDK